MTKRTTSKINNTARRTKHKDVRITVSTAPNIGKTEQPGIEQFKERAAVTSTTREAYATRIRKRVSEDN